MGRLYKLLLTLVAISALLFIGFHFHHIVAFHAVNVSEYQIADLGTLGSDADRYMPVAINEKGEIAGLVDFGRPGGLGGYVTHVFLWRNKRLADLGSFGGKSCSVQAISEAGNLVGTVVLEEKPGEYREKGFSWSAGKTIFLPTLSGFSNNYPLTITSNEEIVGVCANPKNIIDTKFQATRPKMLLKEAYLFSHNHLSAMISLPYKMTAVSSNLQYFLVSDGVSNFQRFRYWPESGKVHALDTFISRSGYVHEISNSGSVVGNADIPGALNHACCWQNGQPQDLGDLGGGFGDAFAINDKSQIVGCSYPSGKNPHYHAFRWQNGKMIDLNNLISPSSHWELSLATGINNRGQIIGWGLHNNLSRAYLLTPIVSNSHRQM